MYSAIATSQFHYSGHSTPVSRNTGSPEMFDFPGLGARLHSIAQALQLPAECMRYVIQIAELGNWKAIQDSNGTLSYRELAKRGRAIELMLLGQAPASASVSSTMTPDFAYQNYANYNTYSPSGQPIPLTPPMTAVVSSQVSFAATVAQSTPAQLIFVDACIYMLHSIVSGPNPRVPELSEATRTITMRFSAIPPHQRTPGLIFPLCIAGILAENSEIQFIQAQINSTNAPTEIVQVVMQLIMSVQQNRWTHELGNANILMS